MKTQGALKVSDGTNLLNAFIELAEQTVEYAKMAQTRLVALASPHLPYFSQLTDEAKKKAIDNLRIFNSICAQVLADGKSLENTEALTWFALKELGLHFPSDMFEYIKRDHVVEIYGMDNVQIFRNFRFFDVTSYTLEELICRPWVELFVRGNAEHTQSIIQGLLKFYSKEVTTVTAFGQLGTQRLIEQDSPFMFEVDAVVDYLAPVYDKSRAPAGFVAIETARVATHIPQGKEAEGLLQKYYKRQLES